MTVHSESLPGAARHGGPDRGGSSTANMAVDATSPLPILASNTLLKGQAAVLIEHLGQHYRLQATRHGKLILTK